MLFTRSRKSRAPQIGQIDRPDLSRRNLGRWLRRGRHRAEALADRLPSDIDHLVHNAGDQIEHWRDEATPVVEAIVERAPRRRRSRRRAGLRIVAGLGLVAAVAVIAYLIWQRRDQQPAYLVDEPDEPLTNPGWHDPSTDTPQGVGGGGPDTATDEPHADEPVTTDPYTPEPQREAAGARFSGTWTPVSQGEPSAEPWTERASRAASFGLPTPERHTPGEAGRTPAPHAPNRPWLPG